MYSVPNIRDCQCCFSKIKLRQSGCENYFLLAQLFNLFLNRGEFKQRKDVYWLTNRLNKIIKVKCYNSGDIGKQCPFLH